MSDASFRTFVHYRPSYIINIFLQNNQNITLELTVSTVSFAYKNVSLDHYLKDKWSQVIPWDILMQKYKITLLYTEANPKLAGILIPKPMKITVYIAVEK